MDEEDYYAHNYQVTFTISSEEEIDESSLLDAIHQASDDIRGHVMATGVDGELDIPEGDVSVEALTARA